MNRPSPLAVEVTADGGFLIADTANQVVRKVSADGVITRVAGTTGTKGSSGDDGPATGAELNNPAGLPALAALKTTNCVRVRDSARLCRSPHRKAPRPGHAR
jgi:hypothetical protein